MAATVKACSAHQDSAPSHNTASQRICLVTVGTLGYLVETIKPRNLYLFKSTHTQSYTLCSVDDRNNSVQGEPVYYVVNDVADTGL